MSNLKSIIMYYHEFCQAFEQMDAKTKALFIDAHLQWATNGMLVAELSIRLNGPLNPEDDE